MIDRLKALGGSTFPTPAQIVASNPIQLQACGFSAAKVATIQAIGQGALGGSVPARAAADQMDDEALITRLVSIKGVVRWTAEMLLMYSLARMDVLPASDFGVREGYRALKSLPEQPKPATLRELAERWSPHRTVAAWYLWRIPRARSDLLP
jgi:DNA-3-methyladenine glycosylase II